MVDMPGYNQIKWYLSEEEQLTCSQNKERVLLLERYNKTDKE